MPSSRIVTISGGSFQRFVGNAFYDAPPAGGSGSVTRSVDLFVNNVTSATIKQNGIAVWSRPADAGLVVQDSFELTITQNAIFGPVRFANVAAPNTLMNIAFDYNTVSVQDDMKVAKPLVVLTASGARKLRGVTIERSLLVECGDQYYLCANLTCGTQATATESVVVRNNIYSGDPSCNGESLPLNTGNVVVNNTKETEPQHYALDQSTGCNGLLEVLGSQTNFEQLPFVNWLVLSRFVCIAFNKKFEI